jgi:hypothetical protein
VTRTIGTRTGDRLVSERLAHATNDEPHAEPPFVFCHEDTAQLGEFVARVIEHIEDRCPLPDRRTDLWPIR